MATSVADPSVVSVILEPITLIVSTIITTLTSIPYVRWASYLTSLVAFPLRLLLIPFRIAASILLTVISPVLLVLSYLANVGTAVWRLLAGLETLYTFIGAAALVGIITGVLLAFTSEYIAAQLGINSVRYGDDESDDYLTKRRYAQKEQHSRFMEEPHDHDGDRGDGEYAHFGGYAAAIKSSTSDLDKAWLDVSSPSPTRRKLASTGLLSQTIHEEDDDDESDAVL